jgi:putative zinc finger/helix-turn-helix YgiT family protein
MSEPSRSLTGSLCSNCRKGQLEFVREDDTFDFRTDEGMIRVTARDVPFHRCPVCGERLSGIEAAQISHRAICKALGLLTPEEILAIRERLRLTQAQFSKLTGIGEATISRWERGRLLQNRANDRYLRLLASGPGMVQLLEAMPGPSAPVTSA